jgi:uncharacterized protein (TIGR03435 family)
MQPEGRLSTRDTSCLLSTSRLIILLLLVSIVSPIAGACEGKPDSVSQVCAAEIHTNGNVPLAFDAVSIRPGDQSSRESEFFWGLPDGYRAKNIPLLRTIAIAYLPRSLWTSRWSSPEILGAPSWVGSERYDIEAKVAGNDLSAWQGQGLEKKVLQSMLRTMLEERCDLTIHHEAVQVPGYALVVSKHGPNWKALKVASVNGPIPESAVVGMTGGDDVFVPFDRKKLRPGQSPAVTFLNTSMASFAAVLSRYGWADRPVVDKTGIVGTYDFVLVWRDEMFGDGSPSGWDDVGQLGLQLKPVKVSVDAIVIDHISRPSEN